MDRSMDSIIRRGQDLDFLDVQSHLEDVAKVTEYLGGIQSFWHTYPSIKLEQVLHDLKQYSIVFSSLCNFSPRHGDDNTKRDDIATSIKLAHSNLYDFFREVKDYMMSEANLLGKYESLEQKVVAGDEQREQLTANVSDIQTDTALEGYQETFYRQANKYKRAANNWLISSIELWILLLVWAILGFYGFDWNERIPDIIFSIGARLPISSLLALGLYTCYRNYKINKHLQTQNEYWESCMQSFQWLAKAQSDPGEQDKMRLEASKIIAQGSSTGYLRPSHSRNSGETFSKA